MSFDLIQLYLWYLVLHALFFAYFLAVHWVTGRIKRPVTSGAVQHVVLRCLISFAIAGLGWGLYFSGRFYWMVIAITLPLDIVTMLVMRARARRLCAANNNAA
jgi:hypothetical protein